MGGKENKERGEGRCGLKSLWAFKRLLPYCFETVQSDISRAAPRRADHTEAAIKTPGPNAAGAAAGQAEGKCRSEVGKPSTVAPAACYRTRMCKLQLEPDRGPRRCWVRGSTTPRTGHWSTHTHTHRAQQQQQQQFRVSDQPKVQLNSLGSVPQYRVNVKTQK